MKPTLCTDVDSTIWDTGAWVCSAVLDITGETLDMGRITTWTHVLDTYGEKTTTAIFDRVFDPERVRDREPYLELQRCCAHCKKGTGSRFTS